MDPVKDLVVEVHDPQLVRRGQLDHADISDLSMTKRDRNVGAWSLTLPPGDAADYLRQPGWGIVVTRKRADEDGDGHVLFAGPLTEAHRRRTGADAGTWSLSGADDSVWLLRRRARPTPGNTIAQGQPGTGGTGYHVVKGPLETVVRTYVDLNAGPGALAERRVPGLTMAPAHDPPLGPTVPGSARGEPVGLLIAQLCEPYRVSWRVQRIGATMQFQVFAPRDLSKRVRFDPELDNADEFAYSYAAPDVTHPTAAGGGDGPGRPLLEHTNPTAAAAAAQWGRFEDWLDAAQASGDEDPTELLQQACEERLADGGDTRRAAEVKPTDLEGVRYAEDYAEGDIVSIVLDDAEIPAPVTEVTMTFGAEPWHVAATVGPTAVAIRDAFARRLIDQQRYVRRFGRLERR